MIPVYLLKISACLALFYGLYYFLFRRFTFHRLNRIYLLLSLLLSFMIPLIELEQKRVIKVAPTVAETVSLPKNENFEIIAPASLNEPIEVLDDSIDSAAETKSWLATLTWEQWSMGMYGIGLLGMLILFVGRLLQVVIMCRKYQNETKKEWIEVPDSFTAASFFGIVFLNSQTLTETETQQVLLHERTHARLFHSADVLFVELCRVVLWFNPIVYLCKKSLIEIHEFEVDAQLATQFDAKTYAHLILKLATQSSHSFLHSFGKHPVTNRIQFLFQTPTTAMKKLLYVFALLLGIAGVWAFAPRKEVFVYKESVAKESVTKAKTSKDVPVKVYPLRVHNKHVWWYFKQQKKEAPYYFSESNLTLNDLCMLESGGVYYLVNPNSLNIKDIAEVNRLTAKRWKVEIAIVEHSLDTDGKLAKISLAIKNLKTNQLSTPEVIDMAEARELGKRGGYLNIDLRNPYWKPQITLEYGDKSLSVSKCSKMGKEHQMYAGLKLSKDEIEYTVYPDKANLSTFQKVSAYFNKEGFKLMISNEKYDTNQQLSSFDVAVTNDKNEVVKRSIVLNDLRHYAHLVTRPKSRNRYDEPLIIRANKISRKIQIETTTERSEYFKKKGLLKPFVSEKAEVKPQKTTQNEVITDKISEEFSETVKDMYSKEIFFKRVRLKAKMGSTNDMLIFARGGEGTTAFGVPVAVEKAPIYYLDGVRVKEEVLKSLRPSHIKKADYIEPQYNRYSTFVKEHKIDSQNEKFVWIERAKFDFKKLPAPTIDRKLSLRLESTDTIRTFLPANDLGKNPLVFINGEEFPASVLTRVDPTKFGMTYVAKPNDPNAMTKYGIRALDGVVEIRTIDECFFKTEKERLIAVENMRKMLEKTKVRLSKIIVTKPDGSEADVIIIRNFEYKTQFAAVFPKNSKIIYMMDGKPVNEDQIKNYKGKFQGATSWKKTGDNSKMLEKYGNLIADYDGGMDIKTTR